MTRRDQRHGRSHADRRTPRSRPAGDQGSSEARAGTQPDHDARPRAFVLMPFSPMMDQVYEVLIRPSLESAGYVVARADSDLNQRAIMQDIVAGIQRADLVVADMTGRNANVFYELGLAQGIRKRVVLLAQSTTDIPFDLGAYRTVIYQVTFDRPPRFRNTITGQLNTLLTAISRSEIAFSSPFSDYAEATPMEAGPATEPSEGSLETMARLQAALPGYLVAIAHLTELSEAIGNRMAQATAQLAEAPAGNVLGHAIAVADGLATHWDGLAVEIEAAVDSTLSPMTDLLEQTLLAAVRLAQLGEYAAEDAANLEPYRGLAEASARNAAVTRTLAASIREISGLTARLRVSGSRLAGILDRIAVTSDRLARLADLIPPAPA